MFKSIGLFFIDVFYNIFACFFTALATPTVLTATTHGVVVPVGFWFAVAFQELSAQEALHGLGVLGRWHAIAFPVTFAIAYYFSRWALAKLEAAHAA